MITYYELSQKRYGKPATHMPVNVLHLMTRLPVGGVENLLLNIIKNHDKRRFTPIVCSLSDKGVIGVDIEALGTEVICLNKLSHRFDYTIVNDLCGVIKARDVKILHTAQYHANLYGRLAARKTDVPCVVSSMHSVYTRDRKINRRIINHLLSRYCDRIIAVSGAVRDDILKYDRVSGDKVEVIHNGIDLERFAGSGPAAAKREFGIPMEAPVIGTIGRLVREKGHKYLIEALSIVLKKFPETRLMLVGDGPLRADLDSLARAFGVHKNVIFTGMRADVPDMLASTDIFAFTSLWEGFGNALLEAMAAGKPVVISDLPSFKEITGTEKIGFTAPVGDSAALAGHLLKLLADPGLCKEFGRNARKRAALFSIQSTVKAYEKLYLEVLVNKGFGSLMALPARTQDQN